MHRCKKPTCLDSEFLQLNEEFPQFPFRIRSLNYMWHQTGFKEAYEDEKAFIFAFNMIRIFAGKRGMGEIEFAGAAFYGA